jgi:hypothetical protein
MAQSFSPFSSRVFQPNSAPSVPPKGTKGISEAAIAKRAYQIFVERGRTHGLDKEDWATAKQQLSAEAFDG